MPTHVRLGSDLLLASGRLRGRARRHRLQPRVGRPGLHAHRRSAGRRRRRHGSAAIFGPQHGFRSDVQDNMIETPHARRSRRGACRSTRSTARRASRPPRCWTGSTCWSSTCRTSARASTPTSTRWPTACAPAARHGVPVIVCDRPNPIGGIDVEGADAADRLRIVRRPVPDPDAPRHDDRRAGAAVQRAVRHRRAARSRADGRLGARRCTATRPACRG